MYSSRSHRGVLSDQQAAGLFDQGASGLGRGCALTKFPIHVFELADHYAIAEITGLSSLQRYN
jgi:hypothetical protein